MTCLQDCTPTILHTSGHVLSSCDGYDNTGWHFSLLYVPCQMRFTQRKYINRTHMKKIICFHCKRDVLPVGTRQQFLLPQPWHIRALNTIARRLDLRRVGPLCKLDLLSYSCIGSDIALEHMVLVEQPNNHRGLIGMLRWQEIFETYTLFKAVCKQGAYGALTEKPTALISLHRNWGTMRNQLSESDRKRIEEEGEPLVTRKRHADGSTRVTGRRRALKATQAYTLEFGRAIVDCWVAGCRVSWLRDICTERFEVFILRMHLFTITVSTLMLWLVSPKDINPELGPCVNCARPPRPFMFETVGEPYDEDYKHFKPHQCTHD